MASRFSIDAIFGAQDRSARTIGRLQARISRMTAGMNRALMAVGRVGMMAAKGLAVGFVAGTAAVVVAMNKVADSADALAKRSRRMEFPIEGLQEWGFVAEQSGLSTDEMNTNLDFFTKNLGAAKNGTGALASMLKKSNPQLLKQMKGTKDTSAAMELYMNAIRKVADPSKRAALATAAFGKSGLKMLQITDQSAEAIEKLRKEQRENGVMSMEQAEAAEAYNDAMNSLKRSLGGFLQGALLPLMPHFTAAARAARAWVVANKGIISAQILAFFGKVRAALPPIIAFFKDSAKQIKEWVDANGAAIHSGFIQFLEKVRANLPEIVKWGKRLAVAIGVFYAIAAAVKVVTAAVAVFNAVAALNPYVLIALAIVAAIGLIVAFWPQITAFFKRFWEDVKFIANQIGDWFSELWTSTVNGLKSAWSSVTGFFASLWGTVKNTVVAFVGFLFSIHPLGILINNWEPIVGFFSGVWSRIKGLASDALGSILNFNLFSAGRKIITTLVDGIKAMATRPVDAIKDMVKKIRDLLPFSPAKTGPLKDLHKVRIAETIAETVKPAPLVAAVKNMASQADDAIRGMLQPGSIGNLFGQLPVSLSGHVEPGESSARESDSRPDKQVFSTLGRGIERKIEETTHTAISRGELVIRDETGKAEMLRAPKGNIKIKLAPSGNL
jgi:hypothetical protein